MCRKYYKPTAQEIKKLRELTGAGMYDCKKALEYTGDMKKAVEYLRTASLYRSYHTDYFWR